MATSLLSCSLTRCLAQNRAAGISRRLKSTATPTFFNRALLTIDRHFNDVEKFIKWKTWWKKKILTLDYSFYRLIENRVGPIGLAAVYILLSNGSLRLAGQSEWFDLSLWKKFKKSQYRDIEGVNMSGTLISFKNFYKLEGLKNIKTLSLRGCPEVDDWVLARLHVFKNSLLELDLSHCSRVTSGGLPALQHLRNLQRLDITGLTQLENRGLVKILVEDMLPRCEVIVDDDKLDLIQTNVQESTEDASIQAGLTDKH